jgi:hypothetical protein
VHESDISQLKSVPAPDDDDSPRSEMTIEKVYKQYPAQVQQLATELSLDLEQPNTIRRIISHCYRQNEYFWFISGLARESSLADFENCIKQMQGLNKRFPTELMNFQQLSNFIGLEYRRELLLLD